MRQRFRVGLLASVAACLLLLPISSFAQTGAISGQIRDATGGVLPGVLVEVTSPALIEKVRSATSDTNGRYQITALPVGSYEVKFILEGFSMVTRGNIVVTSDFNAPVNADMKVGARSETVDVVGEAPIVDVRNARVQQVLTGEDIAALPTQRDIPSVLNLVPSLSGSAFRGTCNGGVGLFCNSTVPYFNSHTATNDPEGGMQQGRIMVDGMAINMGRGGGGINENVGIANGIVLDTANAQEVSFTLSGSLGESETGGAAINIVPRTGGNRYAGSYFTSYTQTQFFDRNRDSRIRWSPTNPNPVQANQAFEYDYDVTGNFGGPVVKDRLWFYLQGRHQGREWYPNGGTEAGYRNLNEGVFGANYIPDRNQGWLTYRNEYKNASVRITLQASQRNKFNIYWDEQDACTNPCYGMINILDSVESYFTLQNRPNRIMQLSWTNPYTNRLLFEAGLTMVPTHQDTTQHREFTNPRWIPRICETGPTVGRDGVSTKVNTAVPDVWTAPPGFPPPPAAGECDVFDTMVSGSINDAFPGLVPNTVINDDTYRSRASASYITGSHNAKFGFEGVYFSERVRNEVNDLRLNYHYQTPNTTGTSWDPVTRSGNCYLAQPTELYPCGNMNLYFQDDPNNQTFLRTKPVGFSMNTGVASTDERVWFGALYMQDQWTVNRFTLNGAIRWDHAESRYGASCVGPDIYVPVQTDGTRGWCSSPAHGVTFNDITPRWGVAWDVFGNGKTSVKWNMGKYLAAAGFGGLYTNFNDARRSTNQITRGWDDINGNRIVECEFFNPAPHTSTQGDYCGTLLGAGATPSTAFLQYGRPPNATQLANSNAACGVKNSTAAQIAYCQDAEQNLMSGWGVRRAEWQFGLGVQHELLPRLSVEFTYNRRQYSNLTDTDTISQGCDYFGPGADVTDYRVCGDGWLNYTDPVGLRDFYSLQAPLDPRLPEGGAYVIRGLNNQKQPVALPTGGGGVTLIRDDLSYAWNGVDTNFVLRARGGLRISGGTSTGRANRDTCYVDVDTPNVRGRVGNEAGGGCRSVYPFQTNVRANASYTIPWVDVLVGTVFQYRPGTERSANLTFSNADVVWEAGSENRTGTLFNTNTGTTPTQTVNLLDTGDLYGEGLRLWDVNFGKNFRFGNKRLNLGVNVYNIFNSDAATGYQNTYTAFRLPDGTWSEDNPATPDVEVNDWGRVTAITSPRFLRFTVQFDF